jgi:hypothetical protein
MGDSDSMFTAAILGELIKIEESPWGDIKGKPLTDRGLADRLRPYGIKPKNIRIGTVVSWLQPGRLSRRMVAVSAARVFIGRYKRYSATK